VSHPETAKHPEGSVEKIKVAAIAGMVLADHRRGALRDPVAVSGGYRRLPP
jgi:hypothetical protein